MSGRGPSAGRALVFFPDNLVAAAGFPHTAADPPLIVAETDPTGQRDRQTGIKRRPFKVPANGPLSKVTSTT